MNPSPRSIVLTGRSTTRRLHRLLLLPALGLTLATTACGGGGEAAASNGVASLATEVAAADASASGSAEEIPAEVTEEELLDWVECMRGEGVDIDDPTVDADGNLTLAPPGGRPDDAGAADAGAADTGGQDNREARQAATEACGTPPLQGGGFGFSEADQTERQDQALAFAACMRDLGYDVADPSLDDGPGGGGRGLFDGLDREDLTVQADLESCQTAAFGEDGPTAGGGVGRGAPGQGQ